MYLSWRDEDEVERHEEAEAEEGICATEGPLFDAAAKKNDDIPVD